MVRSKTPSREDAAPSNRNRYLDLLANLGIAEKIPLWSVRQVDAFLKAWGPQSLSRLPSHQVIGCGPQVSGGFYLAGWQFPQLVGALQLAQVYLAQVLGKKMSVDWDW